MSSSMTVVMLLAHALAPVKGTGGAMEVMPVAINSGAALPVAAIGR